MPNYIKNRLEIQGTKEQVQEVLNKFSTEFPSVPNTSFDGKLIYINKSTDSYGWLDEKTGEFEQRNREKVKEVPEGFVQDFTEAWVRFPDFNKIVSMPESLNITSDGFIMPLENKFSADTRFKDNIDKLKDYCKNLSEENKAKTIDNFIAGIKNYIEYGHATWYSWCIENWGTKWNSSECETKSDTVFDFVTAWSGVPDLIALLSKQFPDITFLYSYSDEDTGCNCGTGKFLNGEIEFNYLLNSSKEAYELAFELRPELIEDYKLVGNTYKYIEDTE